MTKSQRTTPHAPCTPNWIQKAPAERALKEEGKIHRGMKAFGTYESVEQVTQMKIRTTNEENE